MKTHRIQGRPNGTSLVSETDPCFLPFNKHIGREFRDAAGRTEARLAAKLMKRVRFLPKSLPVNS